MQSRSTASDQVLLLDLGDQTVMVEIMSVLMEETMELRGDCQREGREPEQQHRIRNGEFADVAPMPGCSPKLHAILKEHGMKGKARPFCGLTSRSIACISCRYCTGRDHCGRPLVRYGRAALFRLPLRLR